MNDYVKTMRQLIGTRPMLLPGVRALIFNPQGAILLQRRLDMPRWCLPSGSVELGETALDALKREVAEETSLVVLEAEPMGLYSGPSQTFTYLNGDEIQCFSIAFVVRQMARRAPCRWNRGFRPPILRTVAIAQLSWFRSTGPRLRTTGSYRGTFLLC